MLKAVLFDLDGTLIDSSADLAASVNYTRSYFGLETLSEEKVISFIGDGMTKLVHRAFNGTAVDLNEAERVTRDYYANNPVVHTKLYSGIDIVLNELERQGISMAVTSNKPTELCEKILSHLNLSHYFGAIYGGSSRYKLKPHADMLELALADLDVLASESVMIGDNWTDIDSGLHAGCVTAFYSNGYGAIKDNQPDFEFTSFDELGSWLDTL